MSTEELAAVQDRIATLTPEQVKTPTMPVDVSAQEAENLYAWCQPDRERLLQAGLAPQTIESLTTLAGALRQAESFWFTERFTKEDAQRLWLAESKKGYDLLSELNHIAVFALRNIPDLLKRVTAMNDSTAQSELMQKLTTFSVLGREHPEPFIAAGVDTTIFLQAQQIADSLADILALSKAEESHGRKKDVRDRVYTLLKEAVDEVRTVGQFVFWKDKERLFGYYSPYKRRLNNKRSHKPAEPIAS